MSGTTTATAITPAWNAVAAQARAPLSGMRFGFGRRSVTRDRERRVRRSENTSTSMNSMSSEASCVAARRSNRPSQVR